MRKYLVAVAVGAMLIASQAAADESAVVSVGDRVGAPTDVASEFTGNQTFLVLLFAALFIGLAAWGLSTNGNGNPASP
ncbi:MAG TPA: hypothetical protein VGG29_18965 [Caulobacteraceae bacterium]|jgi:hypothetical protein